MRVRISFSSREPLILPINYNYIVQAFIYKNLSRDFSEFLHNLGFKLGGRSFKLFTFSRLLGRFEVLQGNKIKIYSPFELIVSSPVDRFIKDFASSLLKSNGLDLIGQGIEINGISVLSELDEEKCKDGLFIKMLSPVVVYKTYIDDRESKKTYYFNPKENEFAVLVRENLLKKAKLLNICDVDSLNFKIEPAFKMDQKYCKIIKYKGTVVKGWMGIYKVFADFPLLKVAYDTGLGSKNSQGFGCFEVIESKSL
ncbi:CRISPR-associated protein, Cas6 family [Caldanaerovirga acetigignens]|uniref:CRISPR-associated endoribonuclease n=1 Tax=Caldanaerovirga acetigignens TaxID=447595 RepID=A0A1M7LE66_9FIRM|nr:CRISPR-associated endoribonuclease Cas6 [Caldanaerovirga acetigignens]SHM76351.1 CRISPR-associated protein, Cas6 family [Caldanaerovirga acetigignens]